MKQEGGKDFTPRSLQLSHVTLRYILSRMYLMCILIACDASGCSLCGPQGKRERCTSINAHQRRVYNGGLIRARASRRLPFSAVEPSAETYTSRGTRSQRDIPPPWREPLTREGYSPRRDILIAEGSRKRAARFDCDANTLSLPREAIFLRAKRGRERIKAPCKIPDDTPRASPAYAFGALMSLPLPHRARN
jgi:hypothetical protein